MDPSQHSDNPMHPNLYKAVKDGRVEDLDQYIDLFDTQLTSNHNTILHVAAHFGKEQHHGIVQALIECAKELDSLDPESASGTRLEILRTINADGDTALYLAVREGDAEIVSLLIAEDPDFQHPPNKAEETPLYLAAERKNGDSMVESILASSKSPAYTGPSGRTALHATIIFRQTESTSTDRLDFQHPANKAEKTPSYLAAERYNGDSIVESILASNESLAYIGRSGRTALHARVIFENTGVLLSTSIFLQPTNGRAQLSMKSPEICQKFY
ncbi:hypothetical protein Vadar_000195 [Vaccinium darrowii]|uniref:Uncharacterized protein n=1 Tax=Vaccinium darrowii TaxID=229202 RepID=A0ACB7XM69_9ERIC|nr:hypothetical protein Vadar_000195 [Vaccinium darrowii]